MTRCVLPCRDYQKLTGREGSVLTLGTTNGMQFPWKRLTAFADCSSLLQRVSTGLLLGHNLHKGDIHSLDLVCCRYCVTLIVVEYDALVKAALELTVTRLYRQDAKRKGHGSCS